MKRQNGVTLNGKLTEVLASQVTVGELTGSYVAATLVTDHVAYGGHHQVHPLMLETLQQPLVLNDRPTPDKPKF